MSEETFISISTEELSELRERDTWLDALECAGVDNWSGVDYAKELMNEWNASAALQQEETERANKEVPEKTA